MKILTLTGVWERQTPTLTEGFEGSKISVEQVTIDVVGIAGELESEVEPEGVTELLESQDKALKDEELILMNEKRKIEATPGEDSVKIVEMTPKDFKYYIHLVDKASAEFEGTDFNLERSSTVEKMLSNSIACYRKWFVSQLRW